MVVFNNIIAVVVIAVDYNITIEMAFIIIQALEMIIIDFRKACGFILKGRTLINHLNKITKKDNSFNSILN